jgi:hypothetical protein
MIIAPAHAIATQNVGGTLDARIAASPSMKQT